VAVLEGRGAVDRCVAHEAGEEVLDGLVAGSMYQVRVRAVTLGGRSDFGDAVSFIVA
jgi:hypothetical protein